MRASHYAQALYELSSQKDADPAVLAERFMGAVRANGDTHLLPRIMRRFEKLWVAEEKKRTIEVVTAVPRSERDISELLKKEPYKKLVSADHKRVVRKTDETLVGGAVVRAGGLEVNGSHKNALLNLYQQLIST
jgi:F0F1-type ATP synthase delta subunit